MSIWDKLFGPKENENNKKAKSHFDDYREELSDLNYRTIDDLEKIVNPLIKKITKIEVQKPSKLPDNSQLNSHFGGHPYFEVQEAWPKTKSEKPLSFIFQIFNEESLELPQSIKLIQFFYDWEEGPWDTENDGWLVKIYKNLAKEKRIQIENPNQSEDQKYCEIRFKPSKSLPDWEGISLHGNNAAKLSCILNEDEPWNSYDETVTKLIEEQNYQSQLGGYPKWVQGESTPLDKNGKPLNLLFQIDSEDNAEIMWGDVGLIYVFYDADTDGIEFTLQCH
jgi:uncharacterized protein YwqG